MTISFRGTLLLVLIESVVVAVIILCLSNGVSMRLDIFIHHGPLVVNEMLLPPGGRQVINFNEAGKNHNRGSSQ